MPQSLSCVWGHIVFSTKNRQALIMQDWESDLHRYLAGICENMGCRPIEVGGTDDHVHIACSLSRTVAIAQLIKEVKGGSSKWLKNEGPGPASFAWLNGYGAFSIGQSQVQDLTNYISGQRRHHRKQSFQDEFRALLRRYEIDFDEQYVWD
jgi:putative transposase